MALNDLLLTLASYPDPTPVTVIEDAVSVASVLGAHIAALSCEVHVEVPGHFISGSAFGLPGIIAGEAGKSRRNAQDLIAAFEAAAARAGVPRERILQKCKSNEVAELLVEYARLRDLTIMPESDDRWLAETVIFGSGRPTLILPLNPRVVRARDHCGGLGFQPRRCAGGLRCSSAFGTRQEGSRGHRSEREAFRQETFR